ncbi:MAG: hypothetical protein ACLRQF_02155 [Thomasclavelia ramosa]
MAGTGSYTKIDGFAILPVLSFAMALTILLDKIRVHKNMKE